MLIDAALPPQMLVDVDRLQQVLGNLLGNSMKFTQSGFVALQVRSLSGDERNADIEFVVEDSGGGMGAEDLKRLFKPFEKGELGDRHRSGAGLGLSISQELVMLMGGRIEASSVPGRGARFQFRLGLPIVAAGAPVPSISEPEVRDRADRRVLLVDDDALNREFHSLLLGAMDCEVEAVDCGAEALKAAARSDFSVCLVDYELPDGKGTELARQLRAILPSVVWTFAWLQSPDYRPMPQVGAMPWMTGS
ncbi:MAG: response regulator [Ahniella sp.]|nr:response regulator [Ahniella sp.]